MLFIDADDALAGVYVEKGEAGVALGLVFALVGVADMPLFMETPFGDTPFGLTPIDRAPNIDCARDPYGVDPLAALISCFDFTIATVAATYLALNSSKVIDLSLAS